MDYVPSTSTLSAEHSVSDQEVLSTTATTDIEADLKLRFSWPDYIVFSLMLLLSATIGVYYGFCAKRPTVVNDSGEVTDPSVLDVLSKGSGLTAFPVAMSLLASCISGVTMIGTPSEIYYYGLQYWIVIVGFVFMGFTLAYVYLPIFLNLNISSSYEYLELRFSKHVRVAACALFVVDEILFLPVILYVPSLTFSQVTGSDIYTIGSITCAVCIFYTSVGGLKAVVWADTLQTILMFTSLVVIVIVGLVKVGGFGVMWTRAVEGDRVDIFNFDPNPLVRHTIWTLGIGGYIYWTAFNAVNQTMVQRYLTLPSLKDAQLSVLYFTIGIVVFVTFCCGAGLLVYSLYYNCDPLKAKMIRTKDQLLPLFVMHTAHHIYGLPGLFIAGVFSAALSSLSTVLNSTTCVIISDILDAYFHIKFESPLVLGLLANGICIGLGLIALGGIYIVSKLGGILQVAYTVSAVAAGATFGVFTLGAFCPYANDKGALCGGLAAVIMMFWICIGSQLPEVEKVTSVKLPVAMDACPTWVNTTETVALLNKEDIFPLYRLSYLYVSSVGLIIVMVVGSLVSWYTGKTDESKLNLNLFAPPMRHWLLQRRKVEAAKAGKGKENEGGDDVLELTSLDEGVDGGNAVRDEQKTPEGDELP